MTFDRKQNDILMQRKEKFQIRVLHVLKSSIFSGAENVVITIIKSLSEKYDMLYLASEGPICKKLDQEKIPYILLREYNWKNIRSVILEYDPHIVHSHDFSASLICASIPGKFSLISHLHYDPPWSRKWNIKTAAFSAIYSRIDRLLIVSNTSANNFFFSKLYKKKTYVTGNPVDKNKVLELSNKSFDKKYDIIFCGRMSLQKNPQRFIEIIKELYLQGCDLKCAMIGGGELLEECIYTVREAHLENNIDIIGFVDNPYLYMKNTCLMCMTSRWEGFGLVALEANVLGIPVLTTRASGISEIFGSNAFEYCDSNKEFEEKIRLLLDDKVAYEMMRSVSLRRAEELCDVEGYMQNIKKIYEECTRCK